MLDLGPILIQYNLILTKYICKEPYFHLGPVLKFWVDVNFGRTLFNAQHQVTHSFTSTLQIAGLFPACRSQGESHLPRDALRDPFVSTKGPSPNQPFPWPPRCIHHGQATLYACSPQPRVPENWNRVRSALPIQGGPERVASECLLRE